MSQNILPESVLEYILHLKQKYSDLKKIYIFGSFVKGIHTRDSDIDMAMIFDHVDDVFDRQIQLMKTRRQYDSRIEPHVFTSEDFEKSHPLMGEILSTGIEVTG